MTDPTIRAALEAMARQLCDDVSHSGGVYDALPDGPACMGLLETKADWRLLAARNNAAFLRALGSDAEPGRIHTPVTGWMRVSDLAAAVEQTAKEAGDG